MANKSELFSTDSGITIEGKFNIIFTDGPPGLDDNSVEAPVPSLAGDTVSGDIYRKISPGAGTDKWKVISGTVYVETPDGGTGTPNPTPTIPSAGSIIITNVTSPSGIIGDVLFADGTIPANYVVTEATTDSDSVEIHIIVEGTSATLSPVATIDGILVTNFELVTAGTRTFKGSVIVSITDTRVVSAALSSGVTSELVINRTENGPIIHSLNFGNYPGTQTELKQNDNMDVILVVDNSSTSVEIRNIGAAYGLILDLTEDDSAGVGTKYATGEITISGRSGQQAVQAIATNSFGTKGSVFTSDTRLSLSQVFPVFNFLQVEYPGAQDALKNNELALLELQVTEFDSIDYNPIGLSIDNQQEYTFPKPIGYTGNQYIDSGTNLTVTATRASNNASSSIQQLIKIAGIAATASITIDGNPSRLKSSVNGVDYTVRINPNQKLLNTPSLDFSAGTWQGSWRESNNGSWYRDIRIFNTDPRGIASFSNLHMTGLSNITGTEITGNSNWEIGGFDKIQVNFSSFSQISFIGISVSNFSKTRAWISGGSELTRFPDVNNHFNGFTIVDSAGNYDPNGDHLWVSDQSFAGANTTGTLVLEIEEIT